MQSGGGRCSNGIINSRQRAARQRFFDDDHARRKYQQRRSCGLTRRGTCPANDTILIRSSNGTQRSWTGLGTNRFVNVDVQSMGGSGTKTVFNGTDSLGNNSSWVFDSGCPTGLMLSPLTASVQTGGTQTFTASGGFAPYTYSILTNNSGGSINPTNGLYTAGTTAGRTDTIRVTDSFGDTANATVNTFGSPTKLIYTAQPTNTTAGQNISAIQVEVQDVSGNRVANSNASITLSIANNPNSGTLSGTLTKNASNGIAVFDDLSINNAGNGYTLSVSSGVLSGATSNAFNIANPFEVTNTDDSGTGSLRQAILNANATNGQQTISFNISGTAPFIISPTSVLPDITDSIILDATTQTGFSGTPIVVLNGVNIPLRNGFTLRIGNNTIKGLVIGGFSSGIVIPSGNKGNTIQGNYIGTVSNGIGANPNNVGIAIFGSTSNVIDGNSVAERNLISGNRDQLLQINADGSGLTTVFTSSNSTPIIKPDWSPDGTKIVFEQSAKIWLINSNGTNLTELTNSGFNSHPRFSPDGTKIAFLRRPNRDPFGDIFTMSLDGSNQTQITNRTEFRTFSYSPDGTKFGLDSVTFPPTTAFFHKEEIAPLQLLEEVANDVFESDWNGKFAVATPTGTSVQNNFGAVELTFSGVSGGGQTTVTPIESRTLSDVSNTFVLNGQAYEISTTASITPPITVCFTVQQRVTLTQFLNMTIRHGEGGSLVDRTISRDFSTKKICASVSSLSPFVLAEEIDTNLPSISGLILDNNGNPLSGVSVGLTGTEERQTQTNSDGTFKFVNLTPNGNYNVSPKQVGYLFNEYNTNFIDLTGEETVFFEGTLNNFSISGQITDGNGEPVENISVALDGSAQNSVETDAGGNYAFTNLPADGFYTITPTATNLSISPTSAFVDALTDDVAGIDFQAFAPTAAEVSVGGRVLTDAGSGIPNAILQLTASNGRQRSARTNSFGYFEFDEIEVGQSYIISVAHKNHRFANPTQVINVSDSITDLHFIAEK